MEGENTSIFGKEHSYVHEMHHSNSQSYLQTYDQERSKYFKALDAIPQAPEHLDSGNTRDENKNTEALPDNKSENGSQRKTRRRSGRQNK